MSDDSVPVPHHEYRELIACRIFYGEIFAFCTATGMDGPQLGVKGKERVMKHIYDLAQRAGIVAVIGKHPTLELEEDTQIPLMEDSA